MPKEYDLVEFNLDNFNQLGGNGLPVPEIAYLTPTIPGVDEDGLTEINMEFIEDDKLEGTTFNMSLDGELTNKISEDM